ncbi:MAG: UDP-N-acetylmuramoyl-tripeptide--D-alanyl-D-alanine ligase [Actinomycetota bacterium]|nr:UDP-N-acetylmuramoyl-tripeptide--D-alanyl-D-alanine ligase [Actinomycetota bacterium]
MGRPDPFFGYSFALRTILFALIPAFALWQLIRLRRALHVFQLEGYKRGRFLAWCRGNPRRATFLSATPAKKALVMTGRARRLLVVAEVLSITGVLLPPAAVHLIAGAPWDILTWVFATAGMIAGAPGVLVAADWLLAPVQGAINRRYEASARRTLGEVAPVVVGVTGSFGKTSTKFAIERLVGPPETVLATPGSFNTPLGICRTINESLRPQHRFFVVEMGAYREGEIAQLCRFAGPRIGVLTAIGPAHLERFGSMEAIRRAKYEIVRCLPPDGVAVMNVDDPEVRALADATEGVKVVRYGLDGSARPDVTAHSVEVTVDGTVFTVGAGGAELRARTRLLGAHALGHILAAVAVARATGRPLRELDGPIQSLPAVEHRLQMIDGAGGVKVIDDAYNSNPEGAAAALEVLGAMPGARKLVVTPGIVELGPLQREANELFGERAARVADTVIVVASLNRDAILSGARRVNGPAELIAVSSLAEATEELGRLLGPGDVVLFENDLPDQLEG